VEGEEAEEEEEAGAPGLEAGAGGAGAPGGGWSFLPTLGGGGRTRAAGANTNTEHTRRKAWWKFSSSSAAKEDEIDKILREYPSLAEAWSDLTVMLLKNLWFFIFAPAVVHWLKTKRECGVPTHAMVAMTVFQVFAFLASRNCLRLLAASADRPADHTKWYSAYTVSCFVGSGCMWLGYGIQGNYTNHADDHRGKCSKERMGIMILGGGLYKSNPNPVYLYPVYLYPRLEESAWFLQPLKLSSSEKLVFQSLLFQIQLVLPLRLGCSIAALISFSINIHVRKRMFAIQCNNLLCLLMPYLVNQVAGYDTLDQDRR
jgi:hypothetical protein